MPGDRRLGRPGPFVQHDCESYLVVNFDLPPDDDRLSLPELLAGLLVHHDPADLLLLRPLSAAETALLRQYQRDSEVEAWAQMVVANEDRIRGRSHED